MARRFRPDPWAVEIAEEYARRIRHLPVCSVVLFGSRARGEAEPDSDIDVMVVVSEETGELSKVLLDIAYDLSCERGCWLVPAICPEKEVEGPPGKYDPFYRNVRKEGIPVVG